jgi:Alpha/beta hydrolase
VPVATADPEMLRSLAVAVGDAADNAMAVAGAAARLSADITAVLAVDPVARWGGAWARSLAERADLLEAMTPVTARLIDAHHLAIRANGADHALTTTLAVPWEDLDGAVNAAAGAVDWLLTHQPAPVVTGFLASLDPAVATALARRRPGIADVPGVRLDVVFAANRRRIELAIAEIDWRLAGTDPSEAVDLAAEREMLIGLLPRHFVVFDWTGDGRLAEWVGPLDADHVAVLIPGMTADKLDVDMAAANAARMLRFDEVGDLAVVTALVYDAPDLIDAALPSAAEAGVGSLARLIDAMPIADRHLTLVGHSYGSLLLGTALAGGLAADLPPRHDVIFIGSPGTGVATAAGLGLDPGNVWAGATDGDIVLRLRGLPDLLARIAVGFPLAGMALDDLYGTLPTDPDFGAQVFAAGDGGHSDYLGSEVVTTDDGQVCRSFEVASAALAAIVAIATARTRRRHRDGAMSGS